MEVDDRRPRSVLPPIGSMRMERSLEADGKLHPRYSSFQDVTTASQVPSPSTTIASAPSGSYSYASSATTAPPLSAYASPTAPKPTEEERPAQPTVQPSLPSISEALSRDQFDYRHRASGGGDKPPTATYTPAVASLPPPRSSLGGPHGPSNPFAPSITHTSPNEREQPFQHPPPPAEPPHLAEAPRISNGFAAINAPHARPKPIQTTGLSQSPRIGMAAAPTQDSSPAVRTNYSAAGEPSPPLREAYRHPTSHSTPATQHAINHHGVDRMDRRMSGDWKQDHLPSYSSPNGPVLGHTESVKRHLESYETEMAFNDVLEGSGRIYDISRQCAARLHQSPRTEISLDVLPNLQEMDDMLRQAQILHTALDRIRSSIVVQQQVLADERNRAYQSTLYHDDANNYSDSIRGGFAVGDAKKRRGKAAPPGRCHSCNRAETPEWRRGPDGARTLCNACGLHYAKLTRKNGTNKQTSVGPSALRTKPDMP